MFITSDKAIVFLIICTILFIPYSALGMQNDSLIPCIRFTTSGRSSVLIKNNTFALKERSCVRIWNFEKLFATDKTPTHEYTFSKKYDEYLFMDLDDSGTKLLLQHQKLCACGWNYIRLHDLSINVCLYPFEANIDDGIKDKKIADLSFSSLNRMQATRFFDANTVVKTDKNAIHIVKFPEQPTEKIELISIDMPMDSFMKSTAEFEDPIIAVDQVGKKFAYLKKGSGSFEGKHTSKTYLFTNHNYRHSGFVFLILRQLLLPQDVVCEIVSRMQFSAVQQIDTEKIKDTILWMEYSPDGSTIALTGRFNNYLCKPQEADRENKNCITKMPAFGLSTFHPNNKTLFVMANKGRALLGIDIKTKKIVYEYRTIGKVGMDFMRREQNQALAFNKKGDKLAVAFDDYCQIYDVSERLQNFLKTYDLETVSEIVLEPEKKVVAQVKKQQKQDKQAENCVVQ